MAQHLLIRGQHRAVCVEMISKNNSHIDMLEAEIGKIKGKWLITLIRSRLFLAVIAFRGTTRLGYQPFCPVLVPKRRIDSEWLQMALADRCCAIAGSGKNIREAVRVQRQNTAIIAKSMRGRVPSGHEGRPVRHADR